MILLDSVVTGATDSNVFRTIKETKVWVWIYATTFGNITMKCSLDNSTYRDFYPDGSIETLTSETTKLYDLPGGLYWKFTGDATTAAAVIYIEGNSIDLASDAAP
jgi:hypothetical protein